MAGIIVGIDGSAHSRRALEWAVSEAAVRQAPLTVLTVHQAMAGWAGGSVNYPGDADLTAQARKKVQEETDSALASLPAGTPAPSVTIEAVNGIPTVELLKAAEGADMIVVGSRGGGGFAKLMLGSVSTQIVHHAHCPVVVIPGERNHDGD
jgi:nucleotide-binding universal stress UspA family protein